ncbi:hypothetical protein D0962_23430 [Leptolyngbyaceae cyanobacterium CCMR0082]|uniref:Uncharacterized protein n=1 Tax=Adonisia turfae CCMR0082 TaxID=2304604 RepID=A0A6M0SDB9_9CYAN|nr:hypothetical protein [Adonisia turfae]NEZ65672.1 hypothetical protein [Adonisia turfae CCMR0082]
MFLLDNPNLPPVPLTGTGAPVFTVGEGALASSLQVDTLATMPGIAVGGQPARVVATAVPESGDLYRVNAENAISVIAIETPTGIATRADDPAAIQDGEFAYDPYSQSIILRSAEPLDGLSVSVAQISSEGIQRQDLLPGPHPEWFGRFPLAGSISIGLAFEQQPTGSMEFECQRSELLPLMNAFRPDTRVDLWGYAVRVTQISYTQELLPTNPQGRFIVQVSLSGANEREVTDPITVREILETMGSTPENPQTQTTVQLIGTIAGVTVLAPEMSVSLNELGSEDTFELQTEFTDRLRHRGLFAEYNTDALVARSINTVASWIFTDFDCLDSPQVTYLGRQDRQTLSGTLNLAPPALAAATLPATTTDAPVISIEAEDSALIGFTNDFPVTKISGTFSGDGFEDDSEDLLGNNSAEPNWNQRQRDRVTLVKGDEDLLEPPVDTTQIQTTSLSFNNSGPTKTQQTEVSEDGYPVSVREVTYGFVFLSRNHMTTVNGERVLRIFSPASVWEKIRDVTTTWIYDDDTGYELGTVTTGQELFSFLSETDDLETYELSLATDAASINELNAYAFRWRSVDEATGRRLRKLSSVYNDISPNEGKYIYFEDTGPNGETITRRRADPTWAEPYYVELEVTHSNSYAQTANPEEPEDLGDGLRRKPPLTTGRESFNRRDIKLKPSPATRKSLQFPSAPTEENPTTPGPIIDIERDQIPDAYTETTQEMSAEGPEYRDFAARTTFSDSLGRPGTAARRPAAFGSTEPESGQSGVTSPADETDYEYVAISPGYDTNGPVRTTLSFPYASTEAEAEAAVRTYAIAAEITNPSRSISISVPVNMQIKPGDRATVTLAGIIYKCRVNAVNHDIQIAGIIDGNLEITGSSQLQLSPDREPGFQFIKRPFPQDADLADGEDGNVLSFTNIGGTDTTLSMGSLLSGKITRRKPNG